MRILSLLAVIAAGCGGCRATAAHHTLLDVPYCRAEAGRCGDHTAREIIGYWEPDTSTAVTRVEDTVAMLAALNRVGLEAEVGAGSIARVCAEIEAGRPAIIVLSGYGDEYHCLTAIGCDPGGREIVCHTRSGPGVVMGGLWLDVLSPRAPWFMITARHGGVEDAS